MWCHATASLKFHQEKFRPWRRSGLPLALRSFLTVSAGLFATSSYGLDRRRAGEAAVLGVLGLVA